ncbi:endonuclease/exonuclease/phosphatase family protein [Bacteroidota bacterium]
MKKILRRIIVYSNLVFAVLLVLSFLSPNISPEKVWWPSFAGLSYPYILLANILFMLFWILRKRREFVISFLAILLGWNTLIRYVSINPGAIFKKGYFESLNREDRHSDRQVKITSFNVRAFDQYNWLGKPSIKQDIIALLREEDPDILCIQEFYSTEHGQYGTEDLFMALDKTPYRHLEYTVSNQRNKYGIAIFSQYPVVARGRIDMNNSLSICSYADLEMEDDTIRIYNMHLQSIRLSRQHYRFIDSLKLRYDNQQLEEIRDISTRLRDAFVKRAGQADLIASHIEQSPYPVIVCGDFNDTPVSYTYRRIKGELMDAFAECGLGIGRTYNGKFPAFRIDYILYGKEFEALHFTRKKIRLSDHFPITAYLRIL